MQNNVRFDAELGEPDHAAALVTFLNALSSFPTTKEIKKLVKEIGKQNQDTSIINQLVYCKLVWGGKVKPAELTPILENPFSRRKVLLELEKQGKMSLASPAFLTKAAMAEADVIMSITDGFASLSPSSSQLAAQWQEEQGERFVYRLTFENDLQIYYILSPAYELDPLNPAYPPNSFLYVIPTEGNDEPTQEELRAIFQELLAGLSE